MNNLNRLAQHPLYKHWEKFLEERQLLPQKGRIFLGLSGGQDSVLLFYFLVIYLKDQGQLARLQVLHVDHQLRKASAQDAQWVEKLCKQFGVLYSIKKLNGQQKSQNIEEWARLERQKFFYGKADKSEDIILLAHHIDDSFEWSLMQQLKSSFLPSSIGIPLINNKIRRPLLCLRKAQIQFLIKKFQLDFCQDESNFDIHFERNYIRQNIIPQIQKRYPNYLKHYVSKAQQLANLLTHKNKINHIPLKSGGVLVQLTTKEDGKWPDLYLRKIVHQLSTDKRGRINEQIAKLKQAFLNSKAGPLSFSGGVKAYLNGPYIYFLAENKNIEPTLVPLELSASEILKFLNNPELLKKIDTPFPFLLFSNDKRWEKINPSIRKPVPLLPNISAEYIRQGYWVSSLGRLAGKIDRMLCPEDLRATLLVLKKTDG